MFIPHADVHSATGDVSFTPHPKGLQTHQSKERPSAGCLPIYSKRKGE